MRGNLHARFLGGGGRATVSCYPAFPSRFARRRPVNVGVGRHRHLAKEACASYAPASPMNKSIRNLERRLICSAVAASLLPLGAQSQPAHSGPSGGEATPLKIRIVVGTKSIAVTLDDNPTARDFVALLPLSLTLEDYAATEKIATLPRKLSTADAPPGPAPQVGDCRYSRREGDLAIFHKPFHYSAGLIRLGRIDSGVEILRAEGRMSAHRGALRRDGVA